MHIILYNNINFFSIFKKKIKLCNIIYFLFFLSKYINLYLSFITILMFCLIYYLNFYINVLIFFIKNILDEF